MSESPDANWVGVVPHAEHHEPAPVDREAPHSPCKHLFDLAETLKPGDPLGRPIHVVCRMCGSPAWASVTL